MIAGLVAFVLATHTAALHGTTPVYDDHLLLEDPRLASTSFDLVRLIAEPYWSAGFVDRLWRPVPLIVLALERRLLGAGPDLHRLIGVLLHATTTVVAWRLFGVLLPSRRAALLAALLFGAHAVHGEALGTIVGHLEVLALTFGVAGAALHVRGRLRGGGGSFVGAAACFGLALGCKENAGAALGWVLAIDLLVLRPRRDLLTSLRPWSAYAGVVAAWALARYAVLGAMTSADAAKVLGHLPLSSRCLVAAEVARDAWLALLVPTPTSAAYPFAAPAPGAWTSWANVALHVGALCGGAWAVRRRPTPTARAALVGLLGVYLWLLPVSNIVPIGVIRADRLLYAPSLPACLVVGALLTPALARGPLVRALVVGALLFASATRLDANLRAWTRDERLWTATVTRFPRAPEALVGLAEYRRSEGTPSADDEARRLVRLALERAPREARVRGRALALLASVELRRLGWLEHPAQRAEALASGEAAARSAVEGWPNNAEAWLLLGSVLSRRDGRESEAEQAYGQAIGLGDPWKARFNRARLRLAMGDHAGALEDFTAAADEAGAWAPPGSERARVTADARVRQAALLVAAGRPREALAALEAAERADPSGLSAERAAVRRAIADAPDERRP